MSVAAGGGMNNTNKWLDNMIYKRLVPTTDRWIELAVQQRNEKMTVSLAYSALLTYNEVDRIILQQQKFN